MSTESLNAKKEIDSYEVDIEDLPRKELLKMIRKMKAGRVSSTEEEKEEDIKKSEEEREKLSKLREEKKGKAESPKVEKDDLPEGFGKKKEDDEDKDEDDSDKDD